jgi:histidinol dehydrogenase
MNVRRFEWEGPGPTAAAVRTWTLAAAPEVDVGEIEREVFERGDEALIELTARFDATESPPEGLRVAAGEPETALAALDPQLRRSMELAAENIRTVAEAQVDSAARRVDLAQGQRVTVREVAVDAAGVYAPGGRAAYPSTVLMCAIPALAAGVERVVLTTPPGPDGAVSPLVLAAAALCHIDEVYAVGGAQAIFALAFGTEQVPRVNVIVGPGNAWVREAKRRVAGLVGIDSLAGPSELMVAVGHDADPELVAFDLCAQAEHGSDSPLLAVAVEAAVLDAVEAAVARLSAERPSVADAPLALVRVPDLSDAIALANTYAPEHLELVEDDAALLAGDVKTAGCVFVGRNGATAFGDYVAGSNHVLPTGGAGRFSGPLGPGVFRRKVATVEIPAEAAAKLAPHADRIARAEGFPVHGESAMIRAQEKS